MEAAQKRRAIIIGDIEPVKIEVQALPLIDGMHNVSVDIESETDAFEGIFTVPQAQELLKKLVEALAQLGEAKNQ